MFKRLFLLSLSSLFILSCTLQEEGTDIETSVNIDECEASGSTNCVIDTSTSELSMNITSSNPLRAFSGQGDCVSNESNPDPDPFNNPGATPNRLYCFDISGTCNEGQNASASVVIVNPPPFIENPLQGALVSNVIADCVRGRFQGQIAANFTGLDASQFLCQRHTQEFELIGKTINDEEERNPAQARRFLDIQANEHFDCSNL